MKKIILSIAIAGLFIVSCNNATKPAGVTDAAKNAGTVDSASMPVMKFDHDTHDFGKITEGDKVNYKFSFTNNGKTPLIISDAVASCGCTIPVWPKAPIAPGASSQIDVTFNSTGKPGLVDKMVTITANTNPRQNVVHMIGEVLHKK